MPAGPAGPGVAFPGRPAGIRRLFARLLRFRQRATRSIEASQARSLAMRRFKGSGQD